MSNEYLRAFVIGSSCLVFLHYFWGVLRFKKDKFNFSYTPYTFLAPVSLGLMNVISLFLAKQFNLSTRNRFILIGLLGPTFIASVIILLKIYNYTRKEWVHHLVALYVFYFIVCNFVLFNLDKYV